MPQHSLKDKKISILLPTHNGEKYIEESINSILQQSYENWDLIIINDASTDKTAEICQHFLKKNNQIKYFENKTRMDISASLNKGFSLAKGDFYTWTSDDNLYTLDAFKIMVEQIEDNAADFVYAINQVIDENGKKQNQFIGNTLEQIYAKGQSRFGACFLYRKKIAQKVGEYSTKLLRAEDFDYFLRIADVGTVKFIPQILYYYRVHPDACSFGNHKRRAESLKQIYKKHFKVKGRQGMYEEELAAFLKKGKFSQILFLLILPFKNQKFMLYLLSLFLVKILKRIISNK